MTEQHPPEIKSTRAESVLDLGPRTRALERVRLVNEMRLTEAGVTPQSDYAPIELLGDIEHAIAFLDLVQASTPPDQLGVVLTSATPELKAVSQVATRLNSGGGLIAVSGNANKETTIVEIFRDPDGTYHCKFGYSARGTTIERTANKGVKVSVNTIPNLIVDESLYRLYKITGNPAFAEVLGIRAEMRGRGATRVTFKVVDPESYYATLGLNPYALRFLSEDIFESLIKGMKKEIARKLHPDVNQPSPEELDYLKRMLASCTILENKETRDAYSGWLK